MSTQQPSLPIRHSDYSPLWVLVPIVLAALAVMASVLVLQSGPAPESTPAAEPIEAAPIAVEQHGA